MEFQPDEDIKLESGKTLHLVGIVCHDGVGHYITIFRNINKNNKWYKYNDNEDIKIEQIANNYNNMLMYNNGIFGQKGSRALKKR